MIDIHLVRLEFLNTVMPLPIVTLYSPESLLAAGYERECSNFGTHLSRGQIGYQQVIFDHGRPYCANIRIILQMIKQSMVNPIGEEAEGGGVFLNLLSHFAKCRDANGLHRSANHTP